MTTIGRIRIKGVRGIRAELPIDLDGRSLLLRGDNGTGKSSIAQALRWALTGVLTSPTAEPLPEVFQRHQLDTDPADCEVTIDLLPKGKIAMKGGKVDDVGTDAIGHAYVSACVRSNPFLRRDELLGFLTSKAAERFKYLEKFLELDRAEHIGSALVTAAKKHAALASEADDRRRRLVEAAAAALPGGGPVPTSGEELRKTLFARAAALGLPVGTATDVDGLTALRVRITVKAPTKGTSSRRGELANAIQQASALAPPDHPRTVLDPLREAEARALETELANVLGEAIGVVEKQPSLDSCPVCEQPVEAATLLQRLRERVALLTEVRTHARRANGLGIDWCRFLTTLDALERVASASTNDPEVFATGRALLHELERRDVGTLSALVLSRLEVLRSTLKTKHDEIPDDMRASDLGTLAGCIDRAIASRIALEAAEATFARHTRLARELQVIAKAVGDARKDVAEDILDSIGGLVTSYYEHIHPPDAKDEVTGAPSIEVKRHGGGTAHVRGIFNKVAIDDPRHIYSDGHLDTVGICVFLALRKRSESGAKLLVLDDVVLSIDIGHAGRLVRLLRDEFKDHQILMFSHNELFMRMCRSPLSGAKDLAIVRWSLERGPQIEGRVTLVEQLRKVLATSGSAVDLANAMRPVLDDLLAAAAPAFELRLPTAKKRGLTVDEYWSQLRPKLVDLKKAGVLRDLTAVFEKIGTPSFFRNALGAHFNEWALECSLRQVQEVAEGILELVDELHCTRCKSVLSLADARNPKLGFECECPGSATPTLRSSAPSPSESPS